MARRNEVDEDLMDHRWRRSRKKRKGKSRWEEEEEEKKSDGLDLHLLLLGREVNAVLLGQLASLLLHPQFLLHAPSASPVRRFLVAAPDLLLRRLSRKTRRREKWNKGAGAPQRRRRKKEEVMQLPASYLRREGGEEGGGSGWVKVWWEGRREGKRTL